MLSQHWNKIAYSCAAAFAGLSSAAAYAVNDLPGGPSVRQLNLHAPATKLAEEQIGCDLLGLLLLVESCPKVDFSGTALDPRNGSFKVNHCQVFHLGHCEMPRLKNLFRCGDFSLKTA